MKTDYDRLYDQLKIICDGNSQNVIEQLHNHGAGKSISDNEYGAHTLLKLAYLNYYIGIFSRIASARKAKGGFSKILFIDAFGGSGLVKIKDTKHYVLGSSILAALNGKFDKIISFEINEEKANLLEKRLNYISPGKTEVILGDVNKKIEEVVDKYVTSKTIVLFFVDPEGMEPSFSNLKTLMDKTHFVDTMLNYSWGVYRLQGRIIKSLNDGDLRRMQTFLPTYMLGKTPDESLLELFENVFGKPYGNNVSIHSIGDKVEYSMILRIRKTQGETKFIDPMIEFGKIIDKYDGEMANKILSTISGDSKRF